MRMLLNKQNRKKLLELVSSGGIVVFRGYFLSSFDKGSDGFFVNCSSVYGGERCEDYSEFIKKEEFVEVFCFEPVQIPIV